MTQVPLPDLRNGAYVREAHVLRSQELARLSTKAWRALKGFAATAAERYRERRRRHAALIELSSLEDSMLRDLGIGRSSIWAAVYLGEDAVRAPRSIRQSTIPAKVERRLIDDRKEKFTPSRPAPLPRAQAA